MKIIHFANINSTNIGNGALIYGAERVIKEDLGPDITFVREAWDDYTFGLKKFDEKFVDFVNNNADALLVGGAVTFNSFRRKMYNTGFRFDLPLPLWEKIKKPIIFYGISYMHWKNQTYPNIETLKKTIQYIIKNNNVLLAVRNDGTKAWLARLTGIQNSRIHEIPDTGLYVPALENQTYPEINKQKKNIIIAFNNENDIYRFGGKAREFIWHYGAQHFGDERLEKLFRTLPMVRHNRKKILIQLAHAMEMISEKHKDVQFILAAHYLDDYTMIGELISLLKERVAHQLTVSTGLLKTSATEYFYGRYKQANLVLAMRIHSMSPSIGLGIPVIPLTYYGRMPIFLKNAGLEDIGIGLFSSDFTAEKITDKASMLLSDPAPLQKRLKEATTQMRQETRKFNQDILGPFLKRAL